jgi:hypothetical protein
MLMDLYRNCRDPQGYKKEYFSKWGMRLGMKNILYGVKESDKIRFAQSPCF